MKKLFLILAVFMLTISGSFALEENFTTYKDTNFIGHKKSEKAKIKAFFRNLNNYSNKHDKDAVKAFYSKDYKSFDGFSYDAFFSSINETFETYPDIKYKSRIKSIKVDKNEAAVEIMDVTTAKKEATTQAIVESKQIKDHVIQGTMESKCHYVVYLKKVADRWAIYSDNIISEETAIKYGSANNMNIDVSSPMVVNTGEEYCISLNVSKQPKDSLMLASLSREEIKYPPLLPLDKFKKVPNDGILERVVNANKNGTNEYSLASLGITEISLNKEKTAINYKMSGIAFLMKRVNVYADKKSVDTTYLKKKENI